MCLSVRPFDDGSTFEWTGRTCPDGRIPKMGIGPDSRIPNYYYYYYYIFFFVLNCRRCCFGNFRIWFSGHGFRNLGSQLWGLGNFYFYFIILFYFIFFALNCCRCYSRNFRIWFSGHGFRDLGFQLWGLGNFRIWFSGHGFQDLGSQLWGLDFHTRGFQDQNLKTFRM